MMNQKPKGIPEELTAEATEEMQKAPIGEELVLEELQPVVDSSEPVPSATPVKKKNQALWRARYYWAY
jgi:hypothetical protein